MCSIPNQSSAAALKKQGYKYVIFANGAWKHGSLSLKKGTPLEVFDFLSEFKKSAENTVLGENVVVIGGGNTAMDAARAAKRVNGVKKCQPCISQNKALYACGRGRTGVGCERRR